MSVLDKLFALVAPFNCLGCGQEGGLLCAWCTPEARVRVPDRCYRCSKASPDAAVCAACRRHTALQQVWVMSEYEGIPKRLIYRLKFTRARAASLALAQLLDEALPHLPPHTVLVPVPTASSRVRQRGYDHAVVLARALARRRKLACLSLLARHGQSRQVGANRAQRQRQLAGAFRPLRPSLVAGADIVLIDDVLTTGATLEHAAAVLKAAGARRVSAAVCAQRR